MATVWLFLINVLIWGSTWIAIKLQVGEVPALLSVTYRFTIAVILLFIICWVQKKPFPKFTLNDHLWMVVQGLFMFCLNIVFFFLAMEYLVSGLVAVVFSSVIIFNTIFSALIFKARLSRPVIIGAVLGLIGLILVFWQEIMLFDFVASATELGFCYGLLSAILTSGGNMVSAHLQKKGCSVLHNMAWGMLYGLLWTLFLVLVTDVNWVMDWSFSYILPLLYLAIAGSIVAFWCYLTLLGRLGPSNAAYVMVMTPIVALIISQIFEGYQWSSYAFIGIFCALLGNVLVLWRR